ncbi:MAG: bifunctional folylpolyglutamate synthase/dihydrofolate synthase [candidate division WOR-3 bacterium]|uniref:tetrahydrofolate synthase n=1 Tax=candidate division WOR-3 bacterium TaxID=2052148 RepID=A0A7C3EMQ2_UNCW3|nr:bifunctional folylpolyglutamate synthase/dihydrofolate synthase [candidate division WOR-3 bacterium]
MNYQQALEFLDALVNYERKPRPRDRFKLDAIRRLLELAGNPQDRLKNVILIAGTKGKGSVAYMIEAGLRACGLKTGLFVSPHLLSVRERIQLQGSWINRAEFARLMTRFRPLVAKQPVSYFELLTAAAFDLFARRGLDYPVIEVGLGGRLDATNLSHPEISVITRIGYDHLKVLGNTLTKIAREKAGIMRPDRPVIVAPQMPEAKKELLAQAEKTGARTVPVEAHARYWDDTADLNGTAFSAFTELGAGRIRLRLLGRHQIENCLTALTTLGILARNDPRIRFEPVLQGLSELVIPGRCQLVEQNPPLLVDTCHNPESGQALARVLHDCFREKVILVYGSLRNKLVKRTLEPLAPYVDYAIAVAPESPRALAPAHLKAIFTRLKVPAETAPDIPTALARARELAIGRMPIVVAGSFYLAGAVLAHLEQVKPES